MSFTGRELISDSKTGYLTGPSPGVYAFDSKRKVYFVALARQMWPNIGKICGTMGISRQTYYNHLRIDPSFRQAMEDIKDAICDELEEVMRQQALTPRGFLDRIALLKAHRPELYDRAKTIKIQTQQMDMSERQARIQVLESIVDSEVVAAVKGRKAKVKGASPQKPL